jgi:hypothetical protein
MPRSKLTEKKTKKYTESDIQNAIENVQSKEMSLRKASFNFKIPLTTLHGRINFSFDSVGTGNSTILSRATEEMLVQMLKMLGKRRRML